MQFCPICPVELLDQYAADYTTHLVLPQYADVPGYLEWYKRRRERGDTIILDNGAYEGKLLTAEALVAIAAELQPRFVIAPDVIGDAKATWELTSKFCEQVTHYESYVKADVAVVIQGPVPAEFEMLDVWPWIGSYIEAVNNFKAVCFPRCLDKARPELIRGLRQAGLWRSDIYCHALGMVNGSLQELRQLASLGVCSCDSSAPIWRGLSSVTLSEWGELNTHGDFAPTIGRSFSTLTDSQRACIAYNLNKVKECCSKWAISTK